MVFIKPKWFINYAHTTPYIFCNKHTLINSLLKSIFQYIPCQLTPCWMLRAHSWKWDLSANQLSTWVILVYVIRTMVRTGDFLSVSDMYIMAWLHYWYRKANKTRISTAFINHGQKQWWGANSPPIFFYLRIVVSVTTQLKFLMPMVYLPPPLHPSVITQVTPMY
jgi:hypothetical protein